MTPKCWAVFVARVILGLTLFATYLGRASVVPAYFGPAGFGGHDFYVRNPEADPLHPLVSSPLRALLALESVVLKVLADETAGNAPGPESSLLKIKGTEIQQAITELLFEAVGNYAHPYVPEALDLGWNEAPIGPDYAASLAPTYFNWRKASIYGGTNGIQKNIIAKMVLGF